MAHIIDSLFVEIGLDATKFDKQQREVLDKFKKSKEEFKKQGSEIEDSTSSIGEAIGALKYDLLGMFAVFTGSKDILQFAAQIAHADAEIGRLSRSTGASAQTISAWQGVAKIFGSTADGMANSFTRISDAVAGFKIGNISPLIEQWRLLSAAGGKRIDINKGQDEVFLQIAENMKAIHDRNPARAGLLGRQMGFDPGTIDLLIQGRTEVQKALDLVHAFGPATKKSTDNARDLAKAWAEVQLGIEGKTRAGMNAETGTGLSFMSAITSILDLVGKDLADPHNYVGLSKLRSMSYADWKKAINEGLFGASGSSGSAAPARATGAFKSNADRVAFIRAEATRQGQSPDVWEKLYGGEGKAGYSGDYDATGKPTSFGAFQLHYPGIGRNTADGLGTQFTRETGLDARDPNTEPEQIAWSMRYARTRGLSAWHGWHGDQWANIQGGGGAGAVHDDHSIHVEHVTINAGAGADGTKIANDFRSELIRRQGKAFLANGGQQ